MPKPITYSTELQSASLEWNVNRTDSPIMCQRENVPGVREMQLSYPVKVSRETVKLARVSASTAYFLTPITAISKMPGIR
jgi:hypothetical protein